ncbi:hypothetical protein ASE73_04940 [Sphingomonas sp. Leaf24]|jgi:hypothetical protein|uniref:DUF4209 domain-containing protein n=1 Tax=unclassified Sphingomonas TaxID=196159 RepID=UPI0006FEDF7F|nr:MULTISPECIES: DUF4209 domain-containing protein [unclassified Sphingomonas]KQM20094.1 hypothetical protein ASE50_04575 [Sphingomonas sp. Leaf5]KQM90871.1 hypothetical protein ASE73_04940 [Sphingomonas sp. Leaf24]KQM94138.1 hypothetical protein ASE70_12175 [Sphingomonas sp. Leaf22]
MDDNTMLDNEGSPDVREQALIEPVSIDDLEAVDLNAITADVRRLDRHVLVDLFRSELMTTLENADPVRERVLRLTANLVGLHLRVEAEGDPFGVQWQSATRRTALPHDFSGDQSEVLATYAPRILHPTLRARFADIAYETGVRRAGRTAIEAYCEIVHRLADGTAEHQFPDIGTRAMDCVKPLERCFMINSRIAKRFTYVEPMEETLRLAFRYAIEERAFFPLAQIGRRVLHTKVIPADEVAGAVADLAGNALPEDYQLAVKECWTLAAEAFSQAGDVDGSRDASINAIEQTLAMADTVSQSSAKAHWVKEALREFRGLGDAKDRVTKLRRRLRELQDQAMDEVHGIEMPLDGIAEVRDRTYEQFNALGLSDALRDIAGFSAPDDVGALKSAVLQQARDFPLSNLFASSYADSEGREIARGPSLDFADEPTEAWYKEHGIRHLEIVRRFRVHGNIEPARRSVVERFSINEQHMLPIVQLSGLIPAGHHHIFSIGFARLWQGDYVTAGHLLFPQVENSLRHLLKLHGHDSSKIEEDGIEGDRSLSVLLTTFRRQLEAILGEKLVWEMDSLLNFRPGPALRNELAHGKMHWNRFFSDEAIMACWLIYLLVILPIRPHWETHVAPALRSMSSSSQI